MSRMKQTIFWISILLINVIFFAVMGIDKRIAVSNGKKGGKKRRRVPENTLLAGSFFGGGLGVLAGMLLFRHKTRKWKFRLGVPLLLAADLVILYGVSGWIFR